MSLSECNCFLQFLKPGMEKCVRNHLYSYLHQLKILCSLNSCWPFCWTSLISPAAEDASGPHLVLWAWLPLDWLWGESEGNWCVLPTSWCPKSLHALQHLPGVHLVFSNSFVSSGTVQDFRLIFCTLWHPDWPLRPMGSPPALQGENYKSKSKWSCLVEVFRQSNICVRMD